MIKRLEMNNFLCFKGQQIIDFTDRDGVILIVGSYDEDPEKSNQAGKTAIMNAILYAQYGGSKGLFGSRGIADREIDLIYEEAGVMADQMEVILTEDIGGEELIIRRGRTKDNKPIFGIAGFGGQKDEQQEQLVQKLGLSFQDFMATAFFQQGDIHTFMNATPAEKKNYLKRWLDFTRWDTYADAAKVEYVVVRGEETKAKFETERLDNLMLEDVNPGNMEQVLTEERAKREQQIVTGKQSEMAAAQELENQPDPSELEQTLVQARKAVGDLGPQKQSLLQRVTATEQALVQAQQSADELASLGQVDDAVVNAQKQIADVDVELQAIRKSVEDMHQQAEAYVPQLNEIEEQRAKLAMHEGNLGGKRDDQVELIEKIRAFGSHCPYDKQPCDRVGPNFVTELEASTQALQAEIAALREQFTEVANQKAAVEATQAQLHEQARTIGQNLEQRGTWRVNLGTQLQTANQQVQRKNLLMGQDTPDKVQENLNQLQQDLAAWDQRITEANAVVVQATEEFSQMAGVTEKRAELHNQVVQAQQLQSGAATRLSEIDVALGSIQERRRQQEEAGTAKVAKEQELQEIQKQLNQWLFLEHMYRKEIPSILTENAFEEVEGETNFVLTGLHSDMQIQFQATRELQRNEEICSVCASPYPARAKTCKVCGFGVRGKKRKDELILEVHQGESIRTWKLVSGGGKALISIAKRIALTKLLQRRKGSQIDWLQMDEIFGTLDKPNRMHTIRMVFDVLLTVMGFRQILVISHTDVGMSGYNVLQVQRHGSYSTVGWV